MESFKVGFYVAWVHRTDYSWIFSSEMEYPNEVLTFSLDRVSRATCTEAPLVFMVRKTCLAKSRPLQSIYGFKYLNPCKILFTISIKFLQNYFLLFSFDWSFSRLGVMTALAIEMECKYFWTDAARIKAREPMDTLKRGRLLSSSSYENRQLERSSGW